ncbi:MAG: penicillin-insensitive murein endopeptidase [Pseudorhodoplanes sp.]|nr:Penicillin-insensitive murein endopeptidase [Pseudorhodoplanes sp.]MBW7949035.1 penicillin-insensitive murein endopeptidase [Pseudorhodoplanes sp.]MCQ3942576.1 penicillin-insensitive murein endopeptidase [Alphaproteobacteria bacterium]
MTIRRAMPLVAFLVAAGSPFAVAQERGTLEPAPLPPLANPADPKTPAKELFGRKAAPLPLAARSIGFYTRGCLAGAIALPVNGKTWQVMRLSRNRNWGHPALITFLERFAARAPKAGWPGILVGDLAQPRGGPMLTGHASHQVGLDADIWLTPMPKRELTRQEREEMSAVNVVRTDKRDIDPAAWTPHHVAVIRAAASDPEVERVLVNAAIKKALCRDAGTDRAWLRKVRPWWGHNYHMHIRIGCPADSPECKPQDPAPEGEGCGKELDYWFRDSILNPPPPLFPPKPKPPITMAELPPACRTVALSP